MRRQNAELNKPTKMLRAQEMVALLKKYDEKTLIQSHVVQKLIRRIDVKTTLINGSKHHRTFDLTIHYYSCDEIIKGFMTNEK